MPDGDAFEALRGWLRMHGDYDVQINLLALYGTIRISVHHLGREVWDDAGMDLDKRLKRALAFLEANCG